MKPSDVVPGTIKLGCCEYESTAEVVVRFLIANGDRWDVPIDLELCSKVYCLDDNERIWFSAGLSHGHSGRGSDGRGVDHDFRIEFMQPRSDGLLILTEEFISMMEKRDAD